MPTCNSSQKMVSLNNYTQEQSGQLLTGTNAATPCLARSHRAPLSLSSVRPMLPSCHPKAFRSTQHDNVTQNLTNLRGIRSICAAASGTEHAAAAAQPDSRRLTQQQPPLLATAHLLQLSSGGGGSDVGLLPLGPGVYAVLDESMCVQYIGISRHISDSLTSHIRELPHLACFAKVRTVMSGSKSDMQKAWKEWVVELGSLPAGNAPGSSTWTSTTNASARSGAAKVAAAASASKTAVAAVPTVAEVRQRVQKHSLPRARDIITASVLEQLNTRGFAILDEVFGLEAVDLARSGAELLHSSLHLREVSSQRNMGRLDEILVMDELDGQRLLLPGRSPASPPLQAAATATAVSNMSNLTSGTPQSMSEEQLLCSSGCRALAQAGALLKSLPHALMQQQELQHVQEEQRQRHRQLQQQQARGEDGHSSGAGASFEGGGGLSCDWMTELAVPESLMLAMYPGNGAYYARHLDNDTGPTRSVLSSSTPRPYLGSNSATSAAHTNSHSPDASPLSSASSASRTSVSRSGPSWQGPPGQRVGDRSITAILYLNSEWDGQIDGGQLRLYHEDGSGGEFTDVEPLSGRMVIFRSRLIEHEVLPAWRPRWAMSAWIPDMDAYLPAAA